MADKVESILRELGAVVEHWDVYPGRPNVTGYFDFGAAETIVFDVHMDTVPVEGMTVPPFGAEVREGKLYGRGACDVKGPMAAMLCAIDRFKKSGATVRYNILFAAVCDEESGFGGVTSFVHRLEKKELPPVAAAIVAEPTLLNPVAAHKGVARWTISTTGVAAHSSTPHLGSNAIYTMAPVIQALEVYAGELLDRTPHPTLGTPTLSVGVIHGGSAVNIVPEHCEIQVDRRLIPGETLASAEAELVRVLEGFAVSVSSPIVAAPPMETYADGPLVQSVLAAATAVGATPGVEYANYCTDGSFYPQIDVPVVVFGPGSIAQAHTKDEWISLEQLEMGTMAYQKIIAGM